MGATHLTQELCSNHAVPAGAQDTPPGGSSLRLEICLVFSSPSSGLSSPSSGLSSLSRDSPPQAWNLLPEQGLFSPSTCLKGSKPSSNHPSEAGILFH